MEQTLDSVRLGVGRIGVHSPINYTVSTDTQDFDKLE
jgi:hypothetical protein